MPAARPRRRSRWCWSARARASSNGTMRTEATMDLPAQQPGTASALPARWYCDPGTVALERGAIFDRAWHLLGHASRLRNAGDHVVADCGGLPVIAVRGADGVVRAFHNVRS